MFYCVFFMDFLIVWNTFTYTWSISMKYSWMLISLNILLNNYRIIFILNKYYIIQSYILYNDINITFSYVKRLLNAAEIILRTDKKRKVQSS